MVDVEPSHLDSFWKSQYMTFLYYSLNSSKSNLLLGSMSLFALE